MPIPTPSWLKDASGASRGSPPRGKPARGAPASAATRPAFPAKTNAAAPPRTLSAEERALKERLRRGGIIGGSAVGGLVLAVVLWSAFYRGPTDCRKGAARRAAVELLLTKGDPITGLTVGSRYRASDFTCSDVVHPPGVLISAHEGTGGVMVWFADPRGDVLNVNLLAKAWTPRLDVAPEIAKEVLDRVERQ
ncbi:MAG: hypothetical protein NVS9B3_14620 [Gemmatimonadaceae bacterium]